MATPRVVARTAGLLAALGGLAAIALVFGTPGGRAAINPGLAALGPITTVVGVAVVRWGNRVPRIFYQVLLAVGVVGIGVFAAAAPTASGAVAVLALMTLAEVESARSVQALHVLREHGLPVAIDDFGTGYSALARLDTLPADHLKLDHSFVSTITTSGRRARLLRSVVGLADALGLALIAEGVESEEQARTLTELGCPLAQGWFFGRPVPMPELAAALGPAAAAAS